MAAKYKLTYFDGAGRGEAMRLCFTVAGVEFEDVRLGFQDWPKMKEAIPGQKPFRFPWLPHLEVDGMVFSQSLPILRYIAKQTGLNGSSDAEQVMIESLLELYGEIIPAYAGVIFAKDDETKKEKVAAFHESFKVKAGFMETILGDNNGGKGFFVGDKISVADIAVFAAVTPSIEIMEGAGSPIDFKSCPLLKGLIDRVGEVDSIKAYNAKKAAKKT